MRLPAGVMGDQKMVARDGLGITKRLAVRSVHLVLRPGIRGNAGDGRRVEQPLAGGDQGDRPLVVAVRDQSADPFLDAGHFAPMAITVRRVVSEGQFGVGPVWADGPERVAEVSALVEILRASPKDAPVLRDGRIPFANVGVRKAAQAGSVGLHAVEHIGLRLPAEETRLAPGGHESQPAVGQRDRVEVVAGTFGQLL